MKQGGTKANLPRPRKPSGTKPPIHMPFLRDAANLSRMRSPITSRSNWAKDSRTEDFEAEIAALSGRLVHQGEANPGCRPTRLIRLHRRTLQSSAAPFRPRVYHPRTGRAPSRLIQCPLNRRKVSRKYSRKHRRSASVSCSGSAACRAVKSGAPFSSRATIALRRGKETAGCRIGPVRLLTGRSGR
jgi:hypothetical protein